MSKTNRLKIKHKKKAFSLQVSKEVVTNQKSDSCQ